VYNTFIALCLAGFGVITIAFAETRASGSTLARALRLLRGVLDAAPARGDVRLRHAAVSDDRACRLGYQVLNVAFLYLPVVYGIAAAK
jgi:hypothetical protein